MLQIWRISKKENSYVSGSFCFQLPVWESNPSLQKIISQGFENVAEKN